MGKPLPTQQELSDPTFTDLAPSFGFSGKITIDQRKATSIPSGVCFAQDGYRERFTNSDDQEVSFVLDVPWGSLASTRQWFLGYSYVDPVANADGSYTLHREIPFQVPKQGYEHLYAHSFDVVSAEGYVVEDPYVFVRDNQGQIVTDGEDDKGNPKNVAAHFPAWADRSTATDGNAKCRVTCRPRPFLCRSDSTNLTLQGGELNRYVGRTPLKPAIQSLSLAGNLNAIVWGAGAKDAGGNSLAGKAIPTAAQYILMPTIEVSMTWYQVPSPPFASLRQALGKVNSADFDFGALLGSPWGAGKLLCVAPPAWKWYRQATGLVAWDCYYSFLYRDQGWNFYPDATGVFNPIQFANNNAPIYASFDFSKLFQSGAPVQWD